MVENTNSTTLEVQGSFALTYMVGRRRRRPGRAWRGVAWRGRQAGVVWLCKSWPTHDITRLELADSWRDSATFLLQLPSARG
jgi:hypothetical protein